MAVLDHCNLERRQAAQTNQPAKLSDPAAPEAGRTPPALPRRLCPDPSDAESNNLGHDLEALQHHVMKENGVEKLAVMGNSPKLLGDGDGQIVSIHAIGRHDDPLLLVEPGGAHMEAGVAMAMRVGKRDENPGACFG